MKKINCPIFTPTAPKKEQAVKEWLKQLESEIQAYWEKTESKKCYNVLKKYSKYLKTLYNEEIYKGNVKEEIDAYFNTINNKKRLIALSDDDTSYPDMCSTPSSLSPDQQKLCSALWAINIPIFQSAAQARIDALNKTTDKGKALVPMLQDLLTFYSGKTTGFTNTDFCKDVLDGDCLSTTNTLPNRLATSIDFSTILQDEISKFDTKYSPFTPAQSSGICKYKSTDPGVQIFSFQQNFFAIADAVENAIKPAPTTRLPSCINSTCEYWGPKRAPSFHEPYSWGCTFEVQGKTRNPLCAVGRKSFIVGDPSKKRKPYGGGVDIYKTEFDPIDLPACQDYFGNELDNGCLGANTIDCTKRTDCPNNSRKRFIGKLDEATSTVVPATDKPTGLDWTPSGTIPIRTDWPTRGWASSDLFYYDQAAKDTSTDHKLYNQNKLCCGACVKLSHTDGSKAKTVYVTVVDNQGIVGASNADNQDMDLNVGTFAALAPDGHNVGNPLMNVQGDIVAPKNCMFSCGARCADDNSYSCADQDTKENSCHNSNPG